MFPALGDVQFRALLRWFPVQSSSETWPLRLLLAIRWVGEVLHLFRCFLFTALNSGQHVSRDHLEMIAVYTGEVQLRAELF